MINIYSGIQVKCNKEDLNKKGVIYCLTFPNGKIYIGQTTQMLHKRMIDHCNKKSNCTKLKRAIQKYKTFTVSILESNLTLSQLNSFESFYIKLFNSNGTDGYNLDSGGINKTHSDETKIKLSAIWKGKTHSDETKRKISESNKGKTHSDETKSKMAEAKKNISDETRRKMSEWQKFDHFYDEFYYCSKDINSHLKFYNTSHIHILN